MKLMLKTLLCLATSLNSAAQSSPPPVYINFVSHNEPGDNLNTSTNYTNAKTNVLQLAAILQPYSAKWNLQTCDEFVVGALNVDDYADNVFRTLETTYGDIVEIDPRSKVEIPGNNIADTYHLLDSAGANPTTTLGGFIYYSAGTPPIDWPNYLTTKYSQSPNYPPVEWNCNIIWGAGSPNHAYDFYNWGIWKPKSSSTNSTTNETLFTTHEPGNSIWYIGSGCPPANTDPPANPGSFDPTDNVSDITGPLKAFIDSIQDHLLPWDRFYSYSITINQSGFGTTLFNKIQVICDSVEAWGASKIQWASLTEKLDLFQNTSLTNSQWGCGETWPLAGVENEQLPEPQIFPNPSTGVFTVEANEVIDRTIEVVDLRGTRVLTTTMNTASVSLDLSFLYAGPYIVRISSGDQHMTQRIIKE